MLENLMDVLYGPCQTMIYRRVKFDVHCSIGLFQTTFEHDVRTIKNYIRLTDTALSITPTTSAILYEYTAIDKAKFAFTNLINTFIHQSCEPVVAYTQVYDTDREPDMIIYRLNDILRDAHVRRLTLMDDSLYRDESFYGVDFNDILTG